MRVLNVDQTSSYPGWPIPVSFGSSDAAAGTKNPKNNTITIIVTEDKNRIRNGAIHVVNEKTPSKKRRFSSKSNGKSAEINNTFNPLPIRSNWVGKNPFYKLILRSSAAVQRHFSKPWPFFIFVLYVMSANCCLNC